MCCNFRKFSMAMVGCSLAFILFCSSREKSIGNMLLHFTFFHKGASTWRPYSVFPVGAGTTNSNGYRIKGAVFNPSVRTYTLLSVKLNSPPPRLRVTDPTFFRHELNAC